MSFIDIVFDGPPSPQEDGCSSPHFVEVEDEQRHNIRAGDWIERGDGYWVLRVSEDSIPLERHRSDRWFAALSVLGGLAFMWVGMAAAVGVGGQAAEQGQFLLAAAAFVPGVAITAVGAVITVMGANMLIPSWRKE